MPTVIGVRKERSPDGSHQHIEGVCVVGGAHHSRAVVVAGLRLGQDWHTLAAGQTAAIREIEGCPLGCGLTPYITTEPDHTTVNNLENLPAC